MIPVSELGRPENDLPVEDMTAERVARNDDTFRKANEQIRGAADEHEFEGPIPFLCECPDEACTEIVRLTREEYEGIRSHPRHFVNAPGHSNKASEHKRVIAKGDGYEVIEKIGKAGEIAEDLAE